MKKGKIAIKIYAAFRDAGKTWDLDEGVPQEFSPFEQEMAWLAQEVANSSLTDLAGDPKAINAGAWLAVELAQWELGTKSTVMLDDAVIHTAGLMRLTSHGKYGTVTDELITEVRLAATALTNVEHWLCVHGRDLWAEMQERGLIDKDRVYEVIARAMFKRRKGGRQRSIQSWEYCIRKDLEIAKP